MNVTSIKYLNLSDNDISDLQGMSALSQLKTLNLANNNIQCCDNISQLSGLDTLTELTLTGNPICLSIGYPLSVFTTMPYLEILDGLSRHDILKNELLIIKDAPSVPKNIGSSLEIRPKTLQSDGEDKSLSRTNAQLNAMEQAFDMQEKALASNMISLVDHKGGNMSKAAHAPFLQILQLWRRHCQQCMTQLVLARRNMVENSNAFKMERKFFADHLREAQMHALSLKGRCTASDEKARATETVLAERTQALLKEQQRAYQMESEMLVTKKNVSTMRLMLSKCAEQLQEYTVGAMLAVQKAVDKLDTQSIRVNAAADRIAFATLLVSQREVQHRNTISMQALRDLEQNALNNSSVQEIKSSVNCSQTFATPALRPEVESLLRTLFRNLDPTNCGKVSCKLLLSCLCGRIEGSSPDLYSIESILTEALGEQTLRNTCSALQLQQEEITWGEFLLHLVRPSSCTVENTPLSYEDYQELERIGVWGDFQWGTIPLDLSRQSCLSHSSKCTVVEQETKRLCKERAGLLKNIQKLNQTMEKRAEMCKTYFIREKTSLIMQIARLQEQNSNLRDQLNSSEMRLTESNATQTSHKERLEDRIRSLEAELALLREKEVERMTLLRSQEESTVVVDKSKYQRLEQEYELMQREMNRKDILNKGLQRDVQRLNATINSLTDDKIKLDADLSACEQKYNMLIIERDNEVERLLANNEIVKASLQSQKLENESLLQSLKAVQPIEKSPYTETAKHVNKSGNIDSNPRSFSSAQDCTEEQLLNRLRNEMHEVKKLSEMETATSISNSETKSKENVQYNAHTTVYAAQLEKLLKLAEQAIGI